MYLHVIYVRLYLSRGERKGTHDKESYWTPENVHSYPVNSKSAARVYRFQLWGRAPQPRCGVRPQSSPTPSSGSPGRRPYLPYLCLPLGHPKRIPAKKEVSGPKRTADTGSGRARDTCEPQHLRAKRGPPGLPRAHPLGRRVLRRGRNLRTCEARELQARAAPPHLSGSRSASASRCRRHCRRRWRPGHDELRTPPPCPPRRELHCGGEGMGRGRREGERKRRTR